MASTANKSSNVINFVYIILRNMQYLPIPAMAPDREEPLSVHEHKL